MSTQLPVITGKPFTPKRNPREYWTFQKCHKTDCTDTTPDHFHEELSSSKTDSLTNGSGWLERKASGELVYHTPWTRKPAPFRPQALKPRIETALKTLARLKKECVTPGCYETHIGKTCADGFVMTATNGHWAILEQAFAEGKPDDWLGNTKGYHAAFLDNAELDLALKRAVMMADEKSRTVYMIGEMDTKTGKGKVWLHSMCSSPVRGEVSGDFTEPVPATVTKPFTAAVDWTYLEVVLGCWPLTLWVKDDKSQLIFEPAGREWRFVVMPMWAEWEKVQKNIESYKAEFQLEVRP